MFARRFAALFAGAMVLLGTAALSAPPASALSCVGVDGVLEDAKTVFTGKIVDAQDGHILVDVGEVWRGSVGEPVWLDVGSEEWSEWAGDGGRVPDGYQSDATWVFAPDDTIVNPCVAWRLEGDLLRHRPDTVGLPDSGGAEPGPDAAPATAESSTPVLGIGSVLIATLLVGLLVWRQRSRRVDGADST